MLVSIRRSDFPATDRKNQFVSVLTGRNEGGSMDGCSPRCGYDAFDGVGGFVWIAENRWHRHSLESGRRRWTRLCTRVSSEKCWKKRKNEFSILRYETVSLQWIWQQEIRFIICFSDLLSFGRRIFPSIKVLCNEFSRCLLWRNRGDRCSCLSSEWYRLTHSLSSPAS